MPATDNGEVDFFFMSNFMKEVEANILKTTIKTFEQRIRTANITQTGGVKCTDIQYVTFEMADVFEIVDGYYNKKPPMVESGTIPFLGATQYNNGVTGFTTAENINKWDKIGGMTMQDHSKRKFKGGCIAITNNGSVGKAYYQQHDFTCSHDITPIYLKHHSLNRHIAMFLIPLLEKSGTSFEYANKWRPKRMRKSKIMLPINAQGSPNWEYMEQTAKEIETAHILQYFNSKLDLIKQLID